MKTSRIFLIAAAALVTAIAALFATGRLSLPSREKLIGVAAIGGPFTLTAKDGKRFDSKSLAGKPYAIFFGFTQCPDVCPTTLLEVSNHLKTLGPKADRLNFVFVSVDYERDTPQHLKAYLESFDPRIIGLTGTAQEIAAITKAFRVFYEKVPTSSGYTINHTATVYLMNAQGRLTGTMSFQEPPENQLAKLNRLVGD